MAVIYRVVCLIVFLVLVQPGGVKGTPISAPGGLAGLPRQHPVYIRFALLAVQLVQLAPPASWSTLALGVLEKLLVFVGLSFSFLFFFLSFFSFF